MSIVNQLVRNTLTGWLAVAIRAALALVMVPILVSQMGKEAYGLIGLLGVIVSMAGVADLGLRSALGRELAEHVARKDSRVFNELATTALLLYVCIASVIAIVGWIIAPWLVTAFKVSESLQFDALLSIRIYGSASIVFSFITPVFSSVLTSYNRFDVVNSIQIVGGIIANLMLLLVIFLVSNSLFAWVGVMLILQLVILFLDIIAAYRFCDKMEIGLKHLNPKRLVPLFSLGGYLYVMQLAQTFSDQADPLILSWFKGPIGVALYQPAAKLSSLFNPLVMTLTSQLSPLTTHLHTEGNIEKIRQIFCLGTKYTLLIGSLVSAGVFVFAEPFARLWLFNSLGNDYYIVAQVMRVYSIVDLLSYASGTQWPVFLGMKKLKFLAIVLVSTAMLNFTLSIYFVGFTMAGIVGVLYGTIISKIVRIILLNIYIVNLLNVKIREYLYQFLLRPLFGVLTTGISAWLMIRNFGCDTWIELFLIVTLTLMIWALFAWIFTLDKNERSKFIEPILRFITCIKQNR